MAQHDERALVLDVADYRETSSLVRVFTEHEGRISLVGRGLRRARGGMSSSAAALQPFNIVRMRFSLKEGATIGNLISVDTELAAVAPHQSIEAYALACYWFEILKTTTQERAGLVAVFSLTEQMLRCQQRQPGLTLEFLDRLARLCAALGFGLEWRTCVACGAPQGNPSTPEKTPYPYSHFSVSRGGVVCQRCAEAGVPALLLRPPEADIARQLHRLASSRTGAAEHSDVQNSSPPTPTQQDLLSFLGVMNRFLVHHLEHPLQTITFVNQALSG